MKFYTAVVALLLISGVALAQEVRVDASDAEEQAYCRYVVEQAKASSTLLRTPSVESGVTQPSTGTQPQTFAGLTGSLSDLRKAHWTDEAAKHNCSLFVASSDASNNIKYAIMTLEKDAAVNKLSAIDAGVRKLDALIAENNKMLASQNTTKLSLYALESTRLKLIEERSTLQSQMATQYLPSISGTALPCS